MLRGEGWNGGEGVLTMIMVAIKENLYKPLNKRIKTLFVWFTL